MIFCGYDKFMFTVIETPTFQRQVAGLWTETERLDFIGWIATHPEAGDVIPGTDGARKVRWAVKGRGKRAGARVVYFNLCADEIVLLVTAYAKAERSTPRPKDIQRS